MTELHERFTTDRAGTTAEIQNMDTARLLAELDDTLQLDVMRVSHEEWAAKPELRLYRTIMAESERRCSHGQT